VAQESEEAGMTKRLSMFERAIAHLDEEIAALQLARQKLLDQQAAHANGKKQAPTATHAE
jgi:hypothetical protein